jgi:hypothetical protein
MGARLRAKGNVVNLNSLPIALREKLIRMRDEMPSIVRIELQ